MTIRELMQKHSGVTLAAVAVVLGVSLVIAIPGGRSTPKNADFFYDLSDGQLFVGSAGEMPPVEAPAGGPGKGVRAYVYSCAECVESDRFVGYVETFTDEAKAALNPSADSTQADGPPTAQALTAIQKGTLVALPPKTRGAEPEWVVSGSAQGQQIVAASQSRCDGRPASRCHP